MENLDKFIFRRHENHEQGFHRIKIILHGPGIPGPAVERRGILAHSNNITAAHKSYKEDNTIASTVEEYQPSLRSKSPSAHLNSYQGQQAIAGKKTVSLLNSSRRKWKARHAYVPALVQSPNRLVAKAAEPVVKVRMQPLGALGKHIKGASSKLENGHHYTHDLHKDTHATCRFYGGCMPGADQFELGSVHVMEGGNGAGSHGNGGHVDYGHLDSSYGGHEGGYGHHDGGNGGHEGGFGGHEGGYGHQDGGGYGGNGHGGGYGGYGHHGGGLEWDTGHHGGEHGGGYSGHHGGESPHAHLGEEQEHYVVHHEPVQVPVPVPVPVAVPVPVQNEAPAAQAAPAPNNIATSVANSVANNVAQAPSSVSVSEVNMNNGAQVNNNGQPKPGKTVNTGYPVYYLPPTAAPVGEPAPNLEKPAPPANGPNPYEILTSASLKAAKEEQKGGISIAQSFIIQEIPRKLGLDRTEHLSIQTGQDQTPDRTKSGL